MPGRRHNGGLEFMAGGITLQPNLLRACAELLKNADRPQRIRNNLILRDLCQAGLTLEGDAASLRQLIESTLAELPPLQRIILTRCDLNDERHLVVYNALHISRRTFYRQRTAAFKAMTCLLLKTQPALVAVREVECNDALDLQLGLSRSLEQVGNWRRAADHIEVLVESSDVQQVRLWLELRLADIYIEAGRTSQANSKLRVAESIAASLFAFDPSTLAVVDLLSAKAALTSDRDEVAIKLLRDALPKVRASSAQRTSLRISDSLIQGLLVCCELSHGSGALEDALASAEEAEEASRASAFVSPILTGRSHMMAALSHVFLWKEPTWAERELLRCYGLASAAGHVYDAATIAAHLSGFYRLSGRPQEALAILRQVLGAARTLGPSIPLATVLVECAYASFAVKRFGDASQALDEVRASAGDYGGLLAVAELLGSQIHLVNRQHQDALLLAECVEQRFSRMGRLRFVGKSLIVQAKALHALGHRAQALRVLRVAVDVLTNTGQPLILDDARRMLAEPSRLARI